jgi:hypothetical protein
MKIGIIGAPCIDEIVHLDDTTQDHPVRHAVGGILYSHCAMERMMRETGNGDRFVPLTWLSEPDRPLLDAALAGFRHLERGMGLWPTDAPTNRVFLVYDERGDRTANCPNVLPPLTPLELTPELLSGLDAIFVNMISGHDVSIDTLELVLDRASSPPFSPRERGDERGARPYVHLDLHALVQADLSEESARAEAGTRDGELSGYGREPRGVREWKRWLAIADSIQVNEVEARWFGDPEVQSEEELLAYVREARSELRLQSLIITRAERGATLYDTRRDETHHIPIPPLPVVEPTGSGDVFGAAYTYAIAMGTKHRRRCAPAAALRHAVEWATWNATLETIDKLLTAPRPGATRDRLFGMEEKEPS